MNPCPCGYWGDPLHQCRCDDLAVERYLSRISGPLLDRIDTQLAVPAVSYGDLAGGPPGEPSAAVRARVEAARARQRARFRALPGGRTNAQMSAREVRRWRRSDAGADSLLREAVARLGLFGAGISPGPQDRAHDHRPGRRGRALDHPRQRGDPGPESGPEEGGRVALVSIESMGSAQSARRGGG